MDPISLLPSLISAGANIFGGAMSAQSASSNNAAQMQMAQQNMQLQRETNAQNVELFHENQDWQTNMANSAYQRQMSDMRLAGLNPILAYQKGGGAPAPSMSSPTLQAPEMKANLENTGTEMGRSIGNAASSAMDAYKTTYAVEAAKAQASKDNAQTDLSRADWQKRQEDINNAFIVGKKLTAEQSSAEHEAKIKGYEAENMKNTGNRTGGVLGHANVDIRAIARSVLESMNDYGSPDTPSPTTRDAPKFVPPYIRLEKKEW
ncbi:DNA pilot protein [Blackfly microvirus SF02]|uniref:DNA pilot protein n=1 Tax=Blackfly microvirus SF02 TaxID=2576452 RepID=A0A4P8PTU1_9VIRU|nr:DNA pilot protein [Blackfly microvirus SF02]